MSISIGKIPTSILSQLEINAKISASDTGVETEAINVSTEQSLFCSTCNLKLEDKAHFKTDWHRLNLKRKLKGLAVLNEDQYDEQDDLSSIEGSDSDEDVTDIVDKEEGSPFASFVYSERGVKRELLVYKQILHSKTKEQVDYLQRLQALQFIKDQDGPFWSLFLLSSGHFVGAVVNLQTGKPILHKSFHRYTTRRKQGGAQSSNDKSKGKAKSAGAGIRRYNEQALNEEIHELLISWKDVIQKSSLIFLRAPVSMRSTLIADISPLWPNDDRIRSFPFATKRPTLAELIRSFEKLFFVQTRNYVDKEEKAKPGVATDLVKTDPLVEKFTEAIKKGKVDILSKLLSSVNVNQSLSDSKGISFLHIAAANTNPKVIEWLLENGADPTKKGEKLSMLPYDAAVSKNCRDAFRKFMAKHLEMWDYSLTNIPSPLTEEMEEAARKLEKERRKKEREKKKAQKNIDAPVVESVVDSSDIVPVKKLKNMSLAGLRKSDKELLGMSQEQRIRLDREKRALAAESRLRSQKSECGNCGNSLVGVISFDKSIYRYCSIECLKVRQI